MNYILDTNVCIKILKCNNNKILEKISTLNDADIFIPAIVRFELFYGAYKSNRPEQTLELLKSFIKSFQTIELDDDIAETAGEIRAYLAKKGTPIGPYDLLIAATALSKEFILVTNNTKKFIRVNDIKLIDWEM